MSLITRVHGPVGALVISLAMAGCSTSPESHADATVSEARPVEMTSMAATQPTLYERLGGYEAISAVVDVFAQKLFDDPVVGVRFVGMSDDSREGFRQKNKNLICNVTGGPCKIISRPAGVAHGGLGIKASEFDIVVGHLVSTLDSFDVPAAEQEELLAIVATLRPDIVEVEDA